MGRIKCSFGPKCWVTLLTAFRPKIPRSKDILMLQTCYICHQIHQEHPLSYSCHDYLLLCFSVPLLKLLEVCLATQKISLQGRAQYLRHESTSYENHMAPHQLETSELQYVEAHLNKCKKSLSNTMDVQKKTDIFRSRICSQLEVAATFATVASWCYRIPPDETFPAPISSSDSAHHFDRSFQYTELCAAVHFISL